MARLVRTVLAGPRERNSGLPQYVDVLGELSAGGTGAWSFRCVSERGEAGPAPVWHLRRGFGSTEGGLVVVGVCLAIAHRSGEAGAQSKALIRRRRLDPTHDVPVTPELIAACRPLHELPLALLVTSEESAPALPELAATGWSIATATYAAP